MSHIAKVDSVPWSASTHEMYVIQIWIQINIVNDNKP